jgi:hypothetical protein
MTTLTISCDGRSFAGAKKIPWLDSAMRYRPFLLSRPLPAIKSLLSETGEGLRIPEFINQ